MSVEKIEAIQSLIPDARFVMDDGKIVNWESPEPQPSETQINAEIKRLKNVHINEQWKRDRKAEYNAINWIELMLDDQINGTTIAKDTYIEIKKRIPKK